MDILKTYFIFQDKITVILELLVLFAAISLTVAHALLKRKNKSLNIWRLLCCVPFCLCVLHFMFFRFSGYTEATLIMFGATYFEALVLVIWQFFYKRKHVYRIFTAFVNLLAILGMLISIVVSMVYPSIGNYTHKDYKEAFLSAVERMKKEYVLSDWKEIDYDALQEKVLPMIEEAQKQDDETAYYIALLNYCYYFYDGHVAVQTVNKAGADCYDEAKQRLAGCDYGLSMFTLENDETVAILVDENSSAYAAGIHNGTVITKWNGVPIEEAKKDIECIYPELSFPVKENEDFLKSMFLAGTGEDSVTVSFIGDNKKEQTITLESMGFYYERLDKAIDRFYHKTVDYSSDNYTYRMLSDDCGYLRISAELPVDVMSTIGSSFTGEFPELLEMIDANIEEMHNSGMTKLIIDLRNNVGGVDNISESIVSLFSDDKMFGHSAGEYIDGKYVAGDAHYVEANGKWSDVKVVVLVNSQCCSAGDNLAYNFSRLPNVTIMGITTSQGIDQCTGGTCVMSDGLFSVAYPIWLTLGENGLPLIDTEKDRLTKIYLDERIKVTDEAAEIIFGDSGKDYELDYALEYIEN